MSGLWIASIDNETTALDRRHRKPWEIGLVLRDADGRTTEHEWIVADVDMTGANETSLQMSGFYERHPSVGGTPRPGTQVLTERAIASALVDLLDQPDADRIYWLGAVPDFDEQDIYRLLDRWGFIPEDGSAFWHYHLIDIETYVAGLLGEIPPWDFDGLLAKLGLEFEPAERHRALGDARMNLAAWDCARHLVRAFGQ